MMNNMWRSLRHTFKVKIGKYTIKPERSNLNIRTISTRRHIQPDVYTNNIGKRLIQIIESKNFSDSSFEHVFKIREPKKGNKIKGIRIPEGINMGIDYEEIKNIKISGDNLDNLNNLDSKRVSDSPNTDPPHSLQKHLREYISALPLSSLPHFYTTHKADLSLDNLAYLFVRLGAQDPYGEGRDITQYLGDNSRYVDMLQTLELCAHDLHPVHFMPEVIYILTLCRGGTPPAVLPKCCQKYMDLIQTQGSKEVDLDAHSANFPMLLFVIANSQHINECVNFIYFALDMLARPETILNDQSIPNIYFSLSRIFQRCNREPFNHELTAKISSIIPKLDSKILSSLDKLEDGSLAAILAAKSSIHQFEENDKMLLGVVEQVIQNPEKFGLLGLSGVAIGLAGGGLQMDTTIKLIQKRAKYLLQNELKLMEAGTTSVEPTHMGNIIQKLVKSVGMHIRVVDISFMEIAEQIYLNGLEYQTLSDILQMYLTHLEWVRVLYIQKKHKSLRNYHESFAQTIIRYINGKFDKQGHTLHIKEIIVLLEKHMAKDLLTRHNLFQIGLKGIPLLSESMNKLSPQTKDILCSAYFNITRRLVNDKEGVELLVTGMNESGIEIMEIMKRVNPLFIGQEEEVIQYETTNN